MQDQKPPREEGSAAPAGGDGGGGGGSGDGGRQGSPGRARRDREQSTVASWYRMTGVGVEFVAAILVGAGLGWWLDGRFGTSPWLLLIGFGLGFAAGMWSLVKMARRTFHD